MRNAVIYTRGCNQQATELQEQICREFARNNGLNVVGVFSDIAKSGISDDRPEFQEMISKAASGTFQTVVVFSFDRFSRNNNDLSADKTKLNACGVQLLSATEQRSDK